MVRNIRLRWLAPVVLGSWICLAPLDQAWASCEGINNAFAYNECLAKQAPQRGHRAPRVTSGDPEASVVERRGRRSTRGRYTSESGLGGVSLTRRNGRTSAVIDPWGGVRGKGTGRRRR